MGPVEVVREVLKEEGIRVEDETQDKVVMVILEEVVKEGAETRD